MVAPGSGKIRKSASMSTMRVTFVADAGATHMLHWARLLQRRGLTIHYLSLDPVKEFSPTIRIKPFGGSRYAKFLLTAPRLRTMLQRLKPDVVHSYYLTNYALMSVLSKPNKLVVTVAGSDLFQEPLKSAFFASANRYVCERAHLIHSVAKHMTSQLQTMGLPGDKILTLPEGIDPSIFYSTADAIGKQPPVVISTRNLRPIYDVATLVRAAPLVLRKRPDTRFLFVGDGEQRQSLQKLIQELGVEQAVSFTGYLPWPELANRLQGASVYVSTALSDGMSASLLQAMNCGPFPVVTDIAANQEWIEAGINGLLFSSGDSQDLAGKIVIALEDQKLRQRAAQLNQGIVRKRGLDEDVITQLIAAYERLL